ncbi:MAG: hypothetical protein KGL39_46245 [Patescibacteria group bacterium]|nr:hypothetical protein [Patescibacteria group bacterium]
MTVIPAWLILSTILSALAIIAIWSRKPTRARGMAVVALLVSLPLSLPIAASGLSWPVPWLPGLTVSTAKQTVIGFKLVEGEAIYVLIDGNPPRYYKLPWSKGTAQHLQDAQRQAGKQGKVGMKAGSGSFFSPGKPNIWAVPQQPNPPKDAGAAPMTVN